MPIPEVKQLVLETATTKPVLPMSVFPPDWVQPIQMWWPGRDTRFAHYCQDGDSANAESASRLSARVPLAVVVHQICALLGSQPLIELERDSEASSSTSLASSS